MFMTPQGYGSPAESQTAEPYDEEKVLPIELIRQHTKTDDIETVTDELLAFYRRAAMEAAEEYTGMPISTRKLVRQSVPLPKIIPGKRLRRTMRIETRSIIAQPDVYYYGLKNQTPVRVEAEVGARHVNVPRVFDEFGFGCCNPCADLPEAMIQYVTGYSCESKFPAAFRLGALKYIAHSMTNPGDLIRVIAVGGNAQNSGYDAVGSANPALASGAIDIWRTIPTDAI